MQSPTHNPWLESRAFDLRFIFGGAAFAIVLPLVGALAPATLLPAFLWAWLVFFEGSHFWATTARSYLDPAFRRENRASLSTSLVFFALPVIAWGASRWTGNSLPKELYGFFIFLWSLYHVLRQHYGFVCVYQARSKLPDQSAGARFLYKRLWAATLLSGLAFAVQWRLPGQFGAQVAPIAPAGIPTLSGLVALAVLAVLAHTWFTAPTSVSRIAKAYFAVVVLFNLWVHVGLALFGPKFPGASNFSQRVMLFLVLNSIFHNTQYHAIVWTYRRKQAPSLVGYWAPALVFGVVFAALNYLGGQLPLPGGAVSDGALGDLAFITLTGIIGHHFYLDSKIWKLRASPSLHRSLDLAPEATA